MVNTLNTVTLKQTQAQKAKQKMFESARITELEHELARMNAAIQAQKNVESDLRKELADATSKMQEAELKHRRELTEKSMKPVSELKEVKRELAGLKEANKALKREVEQKENKLRLEMLSKVEEIATAYEKV